MMITYPIHIPLETARCAAEFNSVRHANDARDELAALINRRVEKSVFTFQTLAYDDLAHELRASPSFVRELLEPLGGGADAVSIARR